MAKKIIDAFGTQMRKWELDWVTIYSEWKVGKNIQQDVNNWLNGFEANWKGGMGKVDTSFAAAGYRDVRVSVGETISKGNFTVTHAGEVKAANAADVLVGRAQRNSMALLFRNNLIQMFKDFDKIVEDGSGLSLNAKVAQFMQQPTFKRAVHMVDKAGRSWRTGNYATMYARTKGSEVYNQTVLSDMNNVGIDVVQVSDIATDTPICSEYAGKYFSLNGDTPGLPVLDITPPFHPNCVHSLLTVRPPSEEAMKRTNDSADKRFNSQRKDFSKAQKDSIDKQQRYIWSNRPNIYAGAEAV